MDKAGEGCGDERNRAGSRCPSARHRLGSDHLARIRTWELYLGLPRSQSPTSSTAPSTVPRQLYTLYLRLRWAEAHMLQILGLADAAGQRTLQSIIFTSSQIRPPYRVERCKM